MILHCELVQLPVIYTYPLGPVFLLQKGYPVTPQNNINNFYTIDTSSIVLDSSLSRVSI